MARKTAEEITRKFRDGMGAASPAYEFGVANPRRQWEEGARGATSAYAAGVQQAISEGRYGKGVEGKQAKYERKVRTTGVQRFSAAATSAAEEYARVAPEIVRITGEASERAKAMPGDTLEQRIQKAVENIRFIHGAWKGLK